MCIRDRASADTIQNGDMVMIKPAMPLGMAVSAKTRAVLPTPSTNIPLKQATRSSRPRGKCRPRASANSTKMDPDMMKRALTNTSGGKDSSEMRMPR